MQAGLSIHEHLSILLIPLCKNNLNLPMCLSFFSALCLVVSYSHLFVPDVTQGSQVVGSVQDFMFLILFLVLIKGIMRQGESKIPLHNPSGGKLFLRPSTSYNKLLGEVKFRTLLNIHNGAFLQK